MLIQTAPIYFPAVHLDCRLDLTAGAVASTTLDRGETFIVSRRERESIASTLTFTARIRLLTFGLYNATRAHLSISVDIRRFTYRAIHGTRESTRIYITLDYKTHYLGCLTVCDPHW